MKTDSIRLCIQSQYGNEDYEEARNELKRITKLAEIAEQMAVAIREWNRAKREREEWRPVPGMVPPDKYLNNAKKANILLTQALEEYEAFQHSVQADASPVVLCEHENTKGACWSPTCKFYYNGKRR